MNSSFDDIGFWTKAWDTHLENYLAATPRCGVWLAATLPWKAMTFLEIAGGSCRDARYLASKKGVRKVIATDFDSKMLTYLEQRFPTSPILLKTENAFNLSFANNSVDISYHNGFYVYFKDEHKIKCLLKEQARVTKKYIIAIVHNAENIELVKHFKDEADSDRLYDIRFFTREELARLAYESGISMRSISMHKFGGRADCLFQSRFRRFQNPFNRVAEHLVPRLYSLQPWSATERIACVIALG